MARPDRDNNSVNGRFVKRNGTCTISTGRYFSRRIGVERSGNGRAISRRFGSGHRTLHLWARREITSGLSRVIGQSHLWCKVNIAEAIRANFPGLTTSAKHERFVAASPLALRHQEGPKISYSRLSSFRQINTYKRYFNYNLFLDAGVRNKASSADRTGGRAAGVRAHAGALAMGDSEGGAASAARGNTGAYAYENN